MFSPLGILETLPEIFFGIWGKHSTNWLVKRIAVRRLQLLCIVRGLVVCGVDDRYLVLIYISLDLEM